MTPAEAKAELDAESLELDTLREERRKLDQDIAIQEKIVQRAQQRWFDAVSAKYDK